MTSFRASKDRIVFCGILFLALALRLFPINKFCLLGDEWYTVYSARHLDVSWMARPYFLLIRFILDTLGTAVLPMRVLSVFFGVCGVAALYFFTKKNFSKSTAECAAFLTAVSPFLIMDSLEIRYYSLFFLMSVLAFYACLCFLKQKTISRFLFVLAAAAAGVLTHLHLIFTVMGFAFYFLYEKMRKKILWIWGALGLGLVISLPFRETIFMILGRTLYRAVPAEGTGMIGWSFSTLVKPFFAIFTFVWGYNMNPLDYKWVFPGLLLFAFLFVRGVLYARRQHGYSPWFWFYFFIFPFLFLILMIEPLSTLRFRGVLQPKHLVFAYVPFILAVALGITSISSRLVKKAVFAGLILMTVVSYSQLLYPSFSTYASRYFDYRRPRPFLEQMPPGRSVVVLEPRAKEPFEFYNKKELAGKRVMEIKEFLEEKEYVPDFMAFASDNWKIMNPQAQKNRIGAENLRMFFEKLSRQYRLTDGFVQYPFLFYVFRAKNDSQNSVVDLPVEPYGFMYADLPLPVFLPPVKILNSFVLSADKPEWSAPVQEEAAGKKKIVIISNLENSEAIQRGGSVATLELEMGDQFRQINLIKGEHLFDTFNDYLEKKAVPPKNIVVTWEKQPLVSGSRHYRGSRAAFKAHLYRFEVPLENPEELTGLRLRYGQKTGALRIWGVYFE